MKIKHIITGALFALVVLPLASARAQTTKSAIIDSVNKQMQRSAKPAKASSSGATTSAKAATPKSNATAKQTRKVQIPAITLQSGNAPTRARAVALPDSGTNAAPPVRRAAKVPKRKPPAN